MHPVHMARKVISRLKPNPPYGVTFIRDWREHRNLTLVALAERVHSTHASISRIERGLQPYDQPMLEALAGALGTDPASLLIRRPADPQGIWSIWEQASPTEREQIVRLAQAIVKAA